ncbi:peptidoglycan-associated lipoprotein Pal [Paramagnetospirillum magneticum]|uniref:Peptidoglycan-associated lipoprotein n=1 Tax=Paramagnetospirillum magneticum (strain ATCC 700264 / AMB-1) TaxID=342108 RepID=Q2W2B2_PARM1|nr:peptidoglycan-associated lipoprotein Pal [Paramagnetospirillum magneticum]BAE52013.1 Outer membrane protein and related peptidoglycan-associated lipo protein [Paramagnetospirillum magneticum AMB-1]
MALIRNNVAVIALLLLVAACESAPQSMSVACVGTPPALPDTRYLPGSPGDFVTNIGDRVFFDTNSSALRSDALATLTRQAVWLRAYPNYQLTVEGHADERGTREYNLGLGDRRAHAVKRFLIAQGVAQARLKIISWGKERPVAFGSNDLAWAQSRRAVTVLE